MKGRDKVQVFADGDGMNIGLGFCYRGTGSWNKGVEQQLLYKEAKITDLSLKLMSQMNLVTPMGAGIHNFEAALLMFFN